MKVALLQLIRTLSYREGDFTLSSGARSSFYIDMKATTLHPEGARLIGELAFEACLHAGVASQIQGVGGLTLGADPIATAVSLAAWRKGYLWPAFLVRKGAKGHGTSRLVEGMENLPQNARLLVVEDVSTTGKSALEAVQKLRDTGFHPAAVLSVVDRHQGASERFEAEKLHFLPLVTLEELRAKN